MSEFVTDSTLCGLHDHKAGQYRSLQWVTAIHGLALLVVVVLSSVIDSSMGGGGHAPGGGDRIVNLSSPVSSGALPPSCSNHPEGSVPFIRSEFPTGFAGKVQVVAERHDLVVPLQRLPELSASYLPTPGVPFSFGTIGNGSGEPSTDCDFGLPDSPPLWTYTSRGLPAGYEKEGISLPFGFVSPRIEFVNPRWPVGVLTLSDTVKVDGVLTCLSSGRLSISSVCESHRDMGFAESVKDAIRQGRCDPALDSAGRPIPVQYRYCCLFVQGAIPSVNVGSSVNAKIKDE